MSRVIKFRAWGGSEKKYFVHFGLHAQSEGYFTDEYIQPDGGQNVIDYEDVIAIQQFTGLTDKNGKEIYEGDIVTSGSGNEVIKFKYGAFYGESGADAKLCMNVGYYTKEAEVIGNIYENPELLKV